MDKFIKKFLEEAHDLIQNLEAILLNIDVRNPDEKAIQEIFRVMHTLKGNSAMFGFHRVDEFTHHLESIYDLIRNKKINLTKEIIDFTLIGVDHIKLLLQHSNELPEELNTTHEKLMKQVIKAYEEALENKQINVTPAQSSASKPADTSGISINTQTNENVFFIYFEPKPDIFKTGNNPLFIVEDITKLGEARVYPKFSKIPLFDEFNPEQCYTSWEILLFTNEDINSIKDIFIFVEDNSHIEITQINAKKQNFTEDIIKEIDKIGFSERHLGVDTIKSILSQVKIDTQQQTDVIENNNNNNIQQSIDNDKNRNTLFNSKDSSISSIRVSSDKLDSLMNLVSEMVTLQARLSLFAHEAEIMELTVISENMEKVSRRLRDIAFSICLIPLESLVTRFQRLVRDLSTELGKEVRFITEGTDTELDKSIIESLNDPIMHILRNSLDHGIEPAEQRIKLGKPPYGTIKLQAYYSGTFVYIEVSDDGAGINIEKVREKAIQKGLISPDATLSKKEILNLIFLPGFSTASKVTDLSGRGVGMDVVKRKITDIRGEVEVDSDVNVGTTITIKLPLTLSIIDGLLVQVADTLYIIPLSVINHIFAAPKTKLNPYNDLIVYEGEEIPYIYLRREFFEPEDDLTELQFIVVNYNDFKVGLAVDKVIGEYQAVLKPIGKLFKNQDFVSGATILGDGTVALVLDTSRIIKQFAMRHYSKH